MLSKQQDQYEEEQPEDVYVRGYKPTDIFNLAPLANVPGKRQIVDRNRSSVFGNNSDDGNLLQSASKPDRMKSDIFFGGNSASTARFGGYEPSVGTSNSRRSSAKDLYERQQQQQAPLHDDAVQYSSSQQEAEREQAFLQQQQYEQLQQQHQEQSISDYQASSASRSISNVFEAANEGFVNLRGARRHYSQYQPTSDIFFRASDEAPTPGRKQSLPQTGAYEPPQWVPSVKMTGKSTSFSNIFGDAPAIDAEVRNEQPARSPQKSFDSREKLVHTFGLSSSDMNREHRGKGSRRSVGGASQIWF